MQKDLVRGGLEGSQNGILCFGCRVPDDGEGLVAVGGEDDMVEYLRLAAGWVEGVKSQPAVPLRGDGDDLAFEADVVGWEALHDGVDVGL